MLIVNYMLTAVFDICLVGFSMAGPPTSAPASRPSVEPPSAAMVQSLVRQLGSKTYADRQHAQSRLAEMGESGVPFLAPYITDASDEVSIRVAEIVGKPSDPVLRVEVAVRLIATLDPDWMERGVHMLFSDPEATYGQFLTKTQGATGANQIVFHAVAERLAESKRRWDRFHSRYERLVQDKPEAAAKELKMNQDTNLYDAEAAYWTAYESLVESRENTEGDGTQAKGTSRPGTRRPLRKKN